QYLVPENQIVDFCDYVAGLGKFNDWAGNYVEVVGFFEKFDRETAATLGELARPAAAVTEQMDLPLLPPGFERFVKKPIDVQILQVGLPWRRHSDNLWWDDLVVPVTIDAGQVEGVRPRMKFMIAGSGEIISATRVGAHRSQATIVRSIRKKPC